MPKNFCILCNSFNIKKIQKYKNISKTFENLFLYKCNDCSTHFSIFKENYKNLKQYYSNSKSGSIGKNNRINSLSDIFAIAISLKRKEYIQKYKNLLNIKKFDSILEIGPGLGHLHKHFTNDEYINYDVVEDDSSMHDILFRLKLNIIEFRNIDDNKYDLIILSHVLEHIINPNQYLDKLLNKLKKNGLIFIDVPCEDWKYKNIDEPHLTFFNKDSFVNLSKKLNLDIISLDYIGENIKVINFYSKFYFLSVIKSFFILFKTLFSIGINLSKKNIFINFFNNSYKLDYVSKYESRWIRCILKKK